MQIKRLITALLFLAIAAQAKVYKIGFAQDTLANDWRKAQVDEARKEAAKYDFLNLIVKDAKGSLAAQIMHIEEFVENGYDFIITSPIEPNITPLALKKALKKDIQVILIDRGVEGEGYTTFIAPDNYKIARQAARYLLKKMEYEGTVLMLQGIEGATPTKLRQSGFEDVANKYKDINIIKRRGNFLRNDAMEEMEKIYANDVAFDAIYSHSDSMLIGARKVMQRYGHVQSVPMIGIDYIRQAKEAIVNGRQLASFTYPTCAKEGIEAVLKLIKGESVPKNSTIETQMVDKNNAMQVDPIF